MVASRLRFIKQEIKKGVRLEVQLKGGIYRVTQAMPPELFAEHCGQNSYQIFKEADLLPKLIDYFPGEKIQAHPTMSLIGYYYDIKENLLLLAPRAYEGKSDVLDGLFRVEERCIYDLKIIANTQGW